MYFLWSGIFLVLWIIFYIARRDVRKEMLVMSFIFGFAGIVADDIFSIDYWTPPTFTGTKIGIESFLIGFAIGGVAAILYEEVFRRKLFPRIVKQTSVWHPAYSIYLSLGIFFFCIYVLNLSSFITAVISMTIPIALMWLGRPDLIENSILTGILLLVVGTIIYFILLAIQPDFIREYWKLDNRWYMKLFLGIPLAEYLFWLWAGMLIGPLYEYWCRLKLVKNKS